MIELALVGAFAVQVVRIAVPYVLAAQGGVLSERSGVINIALEGKLLIGAFAAAVGAYYGGTVWAGVGLGVLAGVATAALYAFAVIRLRADQIVSGVAINLLALGLTRFLLKLVFDSTASSPQVPGTAALVFAEPLLWMVIAIVVAAHVIVNRGRFGLRLRAVGDLPEAADSVGVDVIAVRWTAVLAAGALAGLGGAWLALANQGFVGEMSGGRGYIALAAVIMGKWRPVAAALACLLFAFAETLQLNLQATGLGVPRELVQMLPYLLTMVVLAGVIGRSRAPAALGKPFVR